jgi:hypothetical protein
MANDVKCISCHQTMAQPQISSGGDGLQMWRVGANILNKE